MMKTPYTYSLLRYFHDPVSGEFANVGVVMLAPQCRFLRAICPAKYLRVSTFFGRQVSQTHFGNLVRHIARQVNGLGESLPGELRFSEFDDVRQLVDKILPPDDSAFQFSASRGGLTRDPEATLNELFSRFVTRYVDASKAQSRSDEQVWTSYREALDEQSLLPRLQPRLISGSSFEYEFPRAWKNGIWNVAKPVSFDLVEAQSIRDKANTWVGRMSSLEHGAAESFIVHLLLGGPRDEALAGAYNDAKNILADSHVEHRVFEEAEASHFAAMVSDGLDHTEPTA